MRTYPIPELASALGAFVRELRSKSASSKTSNTSARPLTVYEPFWPAARGSSGFAVQDIEEAEDWEECLVLTPEDRREYRQWQKRCWGFTTV